MIYNRTYPKKNRLRRAQTSHFKKVILDISKKSRLVRKFLYTIKSKKNNTVMTITRLLEHSDVFKTLSKHF